VFNFVVFWSALAMVALHYDGHESIKATRMIMFSFFYD